MNQVFANPIKKFISEDLLMRQFVISTDTTSDLPSSYIKERDIDVHSLYYSFGETVYCAANPLTEKEFYQRMRDGAMPNTMATNPEESAALFRKRAKDGVDILHIAFSSALSSSYNNACIAANEVMEEYPDCKIIVIDSLSASLGEGLMIYRAFQLKDEGKSIDEVAEYINNHILNFVHLFTVDDLHHLHRGGRVSKATAIIGTLASIKPVLHVDNAGKLVSIGKVRGRKKALTDLVDRMETLIGSYRHETDKVFISHGDCIEDAEYVAAKVKERFDMDVVINYVCPTIGAHSGPGTIALFFMGDER